MKVNNRFNPDIRPIFRSISPRTMGVYKSQQDSFDSRAADLEIISHPKIRWSLPIFTFLSVSIILAVCGAFLVNQILSLPREFAIGSITYQVGMEIKTSLGTLVVEHVDEVAGLTAADLAGNTHGIQNYISPDKIQIQTFVRFTNTLPYPIDYSPQQFRLKKLNNPNSLPLFGASIQAGTLQPGTSIHATLSFVTERDGSNLWIEYHDPAITQPIYVDLGTVDNHPEKDTTGHSH